MTDPEQYQAAHLRRALAEDPRTTELGVRVTVRGGHVMVAGEVASEQRCQDIEMVLHEAAPQLRIYNELHVVSASEPDGEERLR